MVNRQNKKKSAKLFKKKTEALNLKEKKNMPLKFFEFLEQFMIGPFSIELVQFEKKN